MSTIGKPFWMVLAVLVCGVSVYLMKYVGMSDVYGTESKYGLKVLVDVKEPLVDVIAVHGLNGHREKSWTADNDILWLRDFLPKSSPNIRISTYGYDSRTKGGEPMTDQTLFDHGVDFVQEMCSFRYDTKTENVPIIFIAHSLGGIVLKSALLFSNEATKGNNEHYRSIKLSTFGILYFGTPHQGANGVQLEQIFTRIAKLLAHGSDNLLKNLESKLLHEQRIRYTNIQGDFVTKFFYETYPVVLPGTTLMVVPKESAYVASTANVEAIAIHKDHIKMVKFESETDEDYLTVSRHIKRMCQDAIGKIRRNWEEYEWSNREKNDIKHIFEVPSNWEPVAFPPFVGRKAELARLHTLLTADTIKSQDHGPRVVVIYGIGGIGKSRLVREYAVLHSTSFTSIFRVDAGSLEKTEASFVDIAQQLVARYAEKNAHNPDYTLISKRLGISGLIDGNGRINPGTEGKSRVIKAVKNWFSLKNNNKWLLVFDGLDDLESFKLMSFLPEGSGGNVVLTSCRRESARYGSALRMDRMNEADAALLLSKVSGAAVESTSEEARHMVKTLTQLPLAIVYAGGYIFTNNITFERYMSIFQADAVAALGENGLPAVLDGDKSVFTAYNISITAIRKQYPEAAELLALSSFLSNEDIEENMLVRGLTKFDNVSALNAIAPLLSYSLADRTNNSFSLHRMVHIVAKPPKGSKEERDMARQAFQMVARTFRLSKNFDGGGRLAKHIISCSKWAEELIYASLNLTDEDGAASVQFGYFYTMWGPLEEALKWSERGLKWAEKTLGKTHSDTLASMEHAGTLLFFHGKHREAEKMVRQLLRAHEQVQGKNHPDTLRIVGLLGSILQAQGKDDDLIKIGARLEKVDDEGWIYLSNPVIFHLAGLHSQRGNYGDAEKQYRRLLARTIDQLGLEHDKTLSLYHALSSTLLHQGKLDEAADLIQWILPYPEETLNANDGAKVCILYNWVSLLRRQGKYAASEQANRRLLKTLEEVQGMEGPQTLSAVQSMVWVLYLQGRYLEAEELNVRVLKGREKILGKDHPDTIVSVNSMAHVLYYQGRYMAAAKMLLRELHWKLNVAFNRQDQVREGVYLEHAILHGPGCPRLLIHLQW